MWSRIYQYPVPGESLQAELDRLANVVSCTAEADRLEARWSIAYQEHIVDQGNLVEKATGEAKIQAQRQLTFQRKIANSPPRCSIQDLNTLQTRQAAVQALMKETGNMTSIEHLRHIWLDVGFAGDENQPARRPHVSKSHIASMLQGSKNIVDL